jgi:two-component system sensor histidine kinase QseC
VITVKLSEADGWCLLSVEDQGPGIDEADRARLFERFTVAATPTVQAWG